MDVRMAAAMAGGVGNVARFCRDQGISRQTFYKWRARIADQGVDGLVERSRRPHRCPDATPSAIEDLVVLVRKELAGDGADHGPDPIRWTLLSRPDVDASLVPSTATIARILARRGLVSPCPAKRPRSSYRRFTAARPNEMWQSDWTEWKLLDGSTVAIAGCLDDHSRLLVALDCDRADADAVFVWRVMLAAIAEYGIPHLSLTDNGMVYSMARRGGEAAFELNLRALGCRPISSTPRHPQTCGKIERFWQTLKKWLRAHGPFSTLEELRAALGRFRDYYNHRRPHRALRGATPATIWQASAPARPAERPLPAPLSVHSATVTATGVIVVGRFHINVGNAWTGHSVTALRDGDHLAIFSGNHLIRALDLNTSRRYQPAQPRPRTYRHRQPQPQSVSAMS
ncbi:MAG TPA: IS481 family transposase [Jatrophihabitans sp.]|nr:IS481 family transposase [Jatrophihabitans sp.]